MARTRGRHHGDLVAAGVKAGSDGEIGSRDAREQLERFGDGLRQARARLDAAARGIRRDRTRETEAELRRSNAVDFDDLLVCAVRVLAEHAH